MLRSTLKPIMAASPSTYRRVRVVNRFHLATRSFHSSSTLRQSTVHRDDEVIAKPSNIPSLIDEDKHLPIHGSKTMHDLATAHDISTSIITSTLSDIKEAAKATLGDVKETVVVKVANIKETIQTDTASVTDRMSSMATSASNMMGNMKDSMSSSLNNATTKLENVADRMNQSSIHDESTSVDYEIDDMKASLKAAHTREHPTYSEHGKQMNMQAVSPTHSTAANIPEEPTGDVEFDDMKESVKAAHQRDEQTPVSTMNASEGQKKAQPQTRRTRVIRKTTKTTTTTANKPMIAELFATASLQDDNKDEYEMKKHAELRTKHLIPATASEERTAADIELASSPTTTTTVDVSKPVYDSSTSVNDENAPLGSINASSSSPSTKRSLNMDRPVPPSPSART